MPDSGLGSGVRLGRAKRDFGLRVAMLIGVAFGVFIGHAMSIGLGLVLVGIGLLWACLLAGIQIWRRHDA